ncbi:MAG: hypothetical protein WC796_05270 [Candidatus Pacearchaeota archaeon]|jgi:hypothetical protein
MESDDRRYEGLREFKTEKDIFNPYLEIVNLRDTSQRVYLNATSWPESICRSVSELDEDAEIVDLLDDHHAVGLCMVLAVTEHGNRITKIPLGLIRSNEYFKREEPKPTENPLPEDNIPF